MIRADVGAEPALRANYLVSHARVLLARGEVQTAMSELEDAIARVPHHAGALALLTDLTFRTQDWTRARQLYGRTFEESCELWISVIDRLLPPTPPRVS